MVFEGKAVVSYLLFHLEVDTNRYQQLLQLIFHVDNCNKRCWSCVFCVLCCFLP